MTKQSYAALYFPIFQILLKITTAILEQTWVTCGEMNFKAGEMWLVEFKATVEGIGILLMTSSYGNVKLEGVYSQKQLK